MPLPLLGLIAAYIGAEAVKGIAGAMAANDAAKAQERAIDNATGQMRQYYDEAKGYQQPYLRGGAEDYSAFRDKVRLGDFTYNDPGFNYQFEADPGYQFRMQQGQQAITNSAAARGMRLSGATMKALQRYGQNFASNEYQNAYGRQRNAYESDRTFGANQKIAGYNMWNNLANMGTNAANTMTNAASNMGANMADLATQRGNVQAAGIMGQANAYGGIGQGLGNAAALQYFRQQTAYGNVPQIDSSNGTGGLNYRNYRL